MAGKTGYEKAAEATGPAPVSATTSSPVVNNGLPPAPIKARKKATPRKRDDDLIAMNKIDAILEGFSPNSALRILGYCTDKQKERFLNYPFATPDPSGRPETLTIPHFKEDNVTGR